MKTEEPKMQVTRKTAMDGVLWFVVERFDYVHEAWAIEGKFKRRKDAFLAMNRHLDETGRHEAARRSWTKGRDKTA